ncbi:hypothetical protein [Phycicoccus sp. CSK15P-2]|nr:hypothetical protein [Phycicoccus sp. CSK15P-2]
MDAVVSRLPGTWCRDPADLAWLDLLTDLQVELVIGRLDERVD